MRFPLPKDGQEGPHKRLKKLFELLEVPLLEYFYKNDHGLMYFNGLHSTIKEKTFNFNAEALGVAEPYRTAGVHAICDDYLKEPLKELMDNTGVDAWAKFKEKYDKYSTRSYLQFKYKPSEELRQQNPDLPDDHLPTCVIDWLETFDKSSGWYDRALSETVLEAIAFGTAPGMELPDWRCIEYVSLPMRSPPDTYRVALLATVPLSCPR
jgi:hypothetical protein